MDTKKEHKKSNFNFFMPVLISIKIFYSSYYYILITFCFFVKNFDKMKKKKFHLRNIVKASIEYCGDDEEKLSYIFDFLTYVIEKKAEEQMNLRKENKVSLEPRQKKIEMKVDETVREFIQTAERLGYSASGMLVNVLSKFFGIEIGGKIRKPKEKIMRNKTVSLKISMYIYNNIKDKINEPLNLFVRKIMKYFVESPEKFLKEDKNRRLGE